MFPYVVVSPAYFAGDDAAWRADADRLRLQQRAGRAVVLRQRLSHARGMARGHPAAGRASMACGQRRGPRPRYTAGDRGRTAGDARGVELKDLAVRPADRRRRSWHPDITMPRGEPVLVTGPSGSGKSTLFRAIAGIWPFGSGRIVVPKDARLMMLPQRPYFPVGPLAAAVAYPGGARHITTGAGSPRRSARSACPRWRSGSTRRRIGTACCRSASSSALASRGRCCRSAGFPVPRRSDRVARRAFRGGAVPAAPGAAAATVVSIGHRSTLAAFHQRRLALNRDGDHYALREAG